MFKLLEKTNKNTIVGNVYKILHEDYDLWRVVLYEHGNIAQIMVLIDCHKSMMGPQDFLLPACFLGEEVVCSWELATPMSISKLTNPIGKVDAGTLELLLSTSPRGLNFTSVGRGLTWGNVYVGEEDDERFVMHEKLYEDFN